MQASSGGIGIRRRYIVIDLFVAFSLFDSESETFHNSSTMTFGQSSFRHFEANFSAHENPAALEGSADSNVLSLACAIC